ncbi:YesL family protein [Enterococcus sp. BWR-S5]|uniref:YesL family protein n=1 Tax=Enterococcus sp. BWR-S5 TaxID=2787714 RepID=UPI001921C577|nr:YesL family protein [Enterococcus sp. BWR-S5]MBL1224085.1 YesL family protein [Enterococcus sp. BWR-S5]
MSQLFSTEGLVYRYMMRLYQIMLLNLLLIISSLPIVTIGAAITAAYGTAFKMQQHTEGNLFHTFIQKFKEEWKKSTVVWLSILGLIILAWIGYPVIRALLFSSQISFYGGMLLVTIGSLMTLYLFPLFARFENKLSATILNALLLAIRHIPYSILVFLLCVGGGLVFPFYFPKLFLLWLFLGGGTVIYGSSLVFSKVFQVYDTIE